MNYFNYERELVSALIKGGMTPDAMDVLAKIEPSMFTNTFLGQCFLKIKQFTAQGDLIDIIGIGEAVDPEDGFFNLAEVCKQSTGAESNVKAYAKRVRQGFYLRKAQETLIESLNMIETCNEERKIGEVAAKIEDALKGLVVETDHKKPRVLEAVIEEYLTIMEDRVTGSESQRRIKTGIESLDIHTGGFNLSDLIVIGGTPGMGKTELMTRIVNGSTNEHDGALIFSMEMDEYQLAERALAESSGQAIQTIRSPQGMTDSDFAMFSHGLGKIKTNKVWLFDEAGLNVQEICSIAKRHKAEHPETKLIAIDYLGLIPTGKAERHDIAVGDISRRLKQLAKELHTPVLLLCQLTSKDIEKRPKNSRRPNASDIKDSSRVQDDADWIIFPYRDEVYSDNSPAKGYAEIIIAKARHGQRGTVYQKWNNGHFQEVNQAMAHNICSQQVGNNTGTDGF